MQHHAEIIMKNATSYTEIIKMCKSINYLLRQNNFEEFISDHPHKKLIIRKIINYFDCAQVLAKKIDVNPLIFVYMLDEQDYFNFIDTPSCKNEIFYLFWEKVSYELASKIFQHNQTGVVKNMFGKIHIGDDFWDRFIFFINQRSINELLNNSYCCLSWEGLISFVKTVHENGFITDMNDIVYNVLIDMYLTDKNKDSCLVDIILKNSKFGPLTIKYHHLSCYPRYSLLKAEELILNMGHDTINIYANHTYRKYITSIIKKIKIHFMDDHAPNYFLSI